MSPPPQPSSRRLKPPSYTRQPKSPKSTATPSPMYTASKVSSTKTLHLQTQRSKGPLPISPASSEIEVELTPTTKPKSIIKLNIEQLKQRTIPSQRELDHLTLPTHNNVQIRSDTSSTSNSIEGLQNGSSLQNKSVRIVDPAEQGLQGETMGNVTPVSTFDFKSGLSSSVPSFYQEEQTCAPPPMPAYYGHHQYHQPASTPPRFRTSFVTNGQSRQSYGRSSAYHDEDDTHHRYYERRLQRSPELFRPAPKPSHHASDFERRARLYAIMPHLKTLEESDYPPPAPYNAAYPHPISAYASPGVNQHALAISGYIDMLNDLVKDHPATLKGSILATAKGGDELWPPALDMVLPPDDGCGIPERLFIQFDSLGAARLSVGAAVAAPYARVRPLSGSPTGGMSSLRSRDGEPISHSQDQFVASHFTPRRPTLPEQSAWRRDSRSYPVPKLDRRGFGGRGDINGFKTEICPVWEDTGLCKFGRSCQYAHGMNELLDHSQITPLPTPPMEHVSLHGNYLPEGSFPFPTSQRKSSLPTLPILPRLDIRRASAPPRDLQVVTELDDHPSFWQQEEIPPIGAERVTPARERPRGPLPNLGSSHTWQHYEFDSYASPTPRPGRVQSYDTPDPLDSQRPHELHHSILSLSTSSSRPNSYTPSSETNSYDWSPLDHHAGQPGSYGSKGYNEHVESEASWSRSAATTSIDFSTGRSIWC